MIFATLFWIIALREIYRLTLVSAYTCYDTDGSIHAEIPSFNQTACDPSAAVSSCCDVEDYCLSNGLCFGQGGDNLLSFQGCTDSKWASPCFNPCNSI
jgi:hypothetical protein